MANDILEVLGVVKKPTPALQSEHTMFENPFSFNGRIRRLEYAISFIMYLVMYTSIIGSVIQPDAEDNNPIVFLIIAIPILWFLWAQGAKRCHDLGNSGWYQLIPFYVFWMLFQDGQADENEYGEYPKGIQKDDILK